MPTEPACPPLETLRHLCLGELPDDASAGVGRHLRECPRCLETVRGLHVDDTLLDSLRQLQHASPDTPADAAVEQLVQRLSQVRRPAPTGIPKAPTLSNASSEAPTSVPEGQ